MFAVLVFLHNAKEPSATLQVPVTFNCIALKPTAVLLFAVVLLINAPQPMAILLLPSVFESKDEITFTEIAEKFLKYHGYDVYQAESEDEAIKKMDESIKIKKWPCYFFESNTSGEKAFEEFYDQNDTLDLNRFEAIGVIKPKDQYDSNRFFQFITELNEFYKTN